jgi:AraC-like DNA-binding protein
LARNPITGVVNLTKQVIQSPSAKNLDSNWIVRAPGELERAEAFFNGSAYAPHRHDTYAIGITLSGKQRFNYRGELRQNESGRCLIIHPDELHDGQAGTDIGMRYRVGYIDPAQVQQVLGGKALPFIENGISDDPRLYQAVLGLLGEMDDDLSGLKYQDALFDLATTMEMTSDNKQKTKPTFNYQAAEMARQYIADNLEQSISLDTLEAITGRDRWQLSRDFRALFGTSPYRYLIMRRLQQAKAMMTKGVQLAEVASLCDFSDQSHMNRHFKKTYGISPKKWLSSLY